MFRQQLAHKTGESKAAYNVKTEQLVNNFVQAEMQEFMQQCNQAAENRRNHCKWTIKRPFFLQPGWRPRAGAAEVQGADG